MRLRAMPSYAWLISQVCQRNHRRTDSALRPFTDPEYSCSDTPNKPIVVLEFVDSAQHMSGEDYRTVSHTLCVLVLFRDVSLGVVNMCV